MLLEILLIKSYDNDIDYGDIGDYISDLVNKIFSCDDIEQDILDFILNISNITYDGIQNEIRRFSYNNIILYHFNDEYLIGMYIEIVFQYFQSLEDNKKFILQYIISLLLSEKKRGNNLVLHRN